MGLLPAILVLFGLAVMRAGPTVEPRRRPPDEHASIKRLLEPADRGQAVAATLRGRINPGGAVRSLWLVRSVLIVLIISVAAGSVFNIQWQQNSPQGAGSTVAELASAWPGPPCLHGCLLAGKVATAYAAQLGDEGDRTDDAITMLRTDPVEYLVVRWCDGGDGTGSASSSSWRWSSNSPAQPGNIHQRCSGPRCTPG